MGENCKAEYWGESDFGEERLYRPVWSHIGPTWSNMTPTPYVILVLTAI